MKIQELRKLVLMLGLAVSAASPAPLYAQTEESSSQSEEKKDDKEPEAPGTGRISAFGEALANFWSLKVAFQATHTYDDNVFLANNFRKADMITKVSSRVSVAYLGRHTRFEASYMPEYNMFHRYDPLNSINHSYFHTFSKQISRQTEIRWNANAYRTPSRGGLPFKLAMVGPFSFMTYSLDALRDGLLISGGSTTAGVTYRFTPRWKMTADFEGGSTLFEERGSPTTPVVTQELIYSAGAKFNVTYAMTPRRTVGVRFSNTYFGFIGPSQHQHYQSVQATLEQKLPRNFLLTMAGGPGFTERQGGTGPDLSGFFDVSLQRQQTSSGFAVGFQRSVKVGLIQESIASYTGTVSGHKNLGRKWISNLSGNYTRAQGIRGGNELELISGRAQIGYRLTPHLTPYVNYEYTHQKNLSPAPTTRNVNRNQIAIGLVYNPGSILGK